MKNRFAIMLALAVLAQGFAPFLEQLAKLPALIEHFHEHHDHEQIEHGEEMSFGKFLSEHFGSYAHHDAGSDHSRLPFHCVTAPSIVYLLAPPAPAEFSVKLPTTPAVCQNEGLFAVDAVHSRLFGQAIFRPPLG